ncbi:MAG: OprO/OprP family phosphate-selective porin [Fimbriiglobus sp.]|jgi:phosphate-selective porin OprO/OprP|nr:OprO/OprP family phosphate-selective porin [Fimbriiglobus sp.]
MMIRLGRHTIVVVAALGLLHASALAQMTANNFPIVPLAEVGQAADVKPADTLTPEMKKAIDDYLNQRKAADDEKQKELIAKALATGTRFPLHSYWDNQLWFETPNKEWRFHVGGRFQFQPIWWAQPQSLKGPAPGNGGLPNSRAGDGVGVLDDGVFFRRVRFRTDGVVYDKFEYQMEVNFEQLNFTTFDHLWVGVKDVPLLGTVRIGQHKVPQGLEMIASDYHQTFLQDRSSLSDAIWTLFAPGVFVMNNYLDQRMVVQGMVHRIQPTQFFTSDFGGGDYAATTRVTGLPIYENEGDRLLHVGASYQWRKADLGRTIQPGGTGSAFGDSQNVVRFRARPELRDATGIQVTLGGNPARFVDTGFLLANHVNTVSPELLWIDGPFSVQAEGAFAFVDNARPIFGPGVGRPAVSPMYWGGYVETSYVLTGEHRGYDKRMGMFDRINVKNHFRWDQCGGLQGTGAWQVAYRYSYLDLNDRGIDGGRMGQHTFGLNWLLNDNAKLQFQYSLIRREVPSPANSGTAHGFGVLAQYYF